MKLLLSVSICVRRTEWNGTAAAAASSAVQGMEIIKQAVVADNADELDQALSLYRQGLGYFMTGQEGAQRTDRGRAWGGPALQAIPQRTDQ